MKTERNLIELIGEEFLRLVEAGEDPSFADFQMRDPNQAEKIREFIGALQVIEKIKSDHGSQPDPPSFDNAGFPKITDYETLGEIGLVGMGVNCDTIQIALNRRVALKPLADTHVSNPNASNPNASNPNALGRFHREARSCASLTTPILFPFSTLVNVLAITFSDAKPLRSKVFVLRSGETNLDSKEFANA